MECKPSTPMSSSSTTSTTRPSMPPKSPTAAKPLTSIPSTTIHSPSTAKMSSAALPSLPFCASRAAQTSTNAPYKHPPFFRGVKPAFLAKHPGLCFAGAAAAATGFLVYNNTQKKIDNLENEVAAEKKRNTRLEREVDCLWGETRRRNLSGK